MTDWSQETLDELWGDFIDGGASPESFAALPKLADLANDPELAEQAVSLAGAIIAAGGAEVRDERLAAELLAAANRLLPASDDYYASLLAAQLAFEGVAYWPNLAESLGSLPFDVLCPSCGTDITLLFDLSLAKASFIDEIGDTSPLQPVDPSALTGIGRRLYDTAASHAQERVMRAVAHLFGQATCPLCAAEFTVAGRVLF
ncbi:hypothetical protein FXN61_25495 [Lentzea sp. PSKA42]|uniref:Uncharacterized protein n=1 Tax=Lentzea indica TaxID=2604800 RepID=A0ABX1FN17_9PSEU|nr:hypothetical protein [Lentzea indica]NKE59971.1 hypothetical protein [Lentzea indica]